MQTKQSQLQSVEKRILQDKTLLLSQDNGKLVFGKGNPDAQILFIGEAPGANEAKQGLPFVGAAGKQLNSFLETINLTIDDCYIANILKFRPPKNRDPSKEEIATHTPYLIEQIHIIKPTIIVTLGNFATKFVLGNFTVEGMKQIDGIATIHGTVHHITKNNHTYTIIPSYHPAAMIYKRSLKETIEIDFKKIQKELKKIKQK